MVQTNSQKMAQAAFASVRRRASPGVPEKYASFARSFPSLVHACGLAQAVTFANAKGHAEYLEDLAAVLNKIGHAEAASVDSLEKATREYPVLAYVRLNRNALQAAGWLKRYVEAVAPE
ncbi:MAG TPA: type III-B CRISPR module-associated protein Cmr5 [Bradyrhizobium sp.]|nr:type III-B CRISPR module-associated protein Cmr5 [Stellaceae bacterium]HUN97977.1 type III-B CRISPR module-associated protein Cmr5 [Bradyrhizobium sp.]